MIHRPWRQISLTGMTLLIVLSIQFCASQKDTLEASNIAETFGQAMEFYEKKNYLRAEETFTFILYNDPGGAYADDAQFYLAETYFQKEEYLTAISEYDRLIRRMKTSPFVEDAFWKKTESYCELSPDYRLEKDMTEKALRYLYDFLDVYPESKYRKDAEARIVEMREKLAMKLLTTGKLYDTLQEWESAIYYYDSIIDEYADTRVHAVARLGKAADLAQLERWDEARQLLNSIAINGREDLTQKELLKFKNVGKQVVENTAPAGE